MRRCALLLACMAGVSGFLAPPLPSIRSLRPLPARAGAITSRVGFFLRMQEQGAAAEGSPTGSTSIDVSNQDAQQKLREQMKLLWDLEVAMVHKDFKDGAIVQDKLRKIAGGGDDVPIPRVGPKSLLGKTVFVAGANGRLGSRVCKLLLRRGCTVRASVRGTEKVEDYSRLSYEIGMEEAEYDIQAPWIRKSIEVNATEEMKSYNIGKLVVVECDLLDEKNVARAVKGCDAVVYCASSFDGGRIKLKAPDVFSPQALFSVTDRIFLESVRQADRDREAASSGAIEGFLDREGVALAAKALLADQRLRAMSGTNMPRPASEGGETKINPFVLVTARKGALPKRGGVAGVLPAMEGYDVEEIKSEGEKLLAEAGLSSSVTIAMARYDENFAGEGQIPILEGAKDDKEKVISRLDAALMTVIAMISDQAEASSKVEVFTKDRDWRDNLINGN